MLFATPVRGPLQRSYSISLLLASGVQQERGLSKMATRIPRSFDSVRDYGP